MEERKESILTKECGRERRKERRRKRKAKNGMGERGARRKKGERMVCRERKKGYRSLAQCNQDHYIQTCIRYYVGN